MLYTAEDYWNHDEGIKYLLLNNVQLRTTRSKAFIIL